MNDWLNRTSMLIGNNNIDKLKHSTICLFGIGGVGSFVGEAFVRCGIGTLILVDKDDVDITNINRQLIATTKTVGLSKVEVAKQRYLDINPDIQIITYKEFVDKENVSKFIPDYCDYIIDAIDTVTAKLALVKEAKKREIKIISSMGTGNKLDPTKFEITDISKTTVCPLAKVMRKELNKLGIEGLKVVYSTEQPIKQDDVRVKDRNSIHTKPTPASISFVPSVCGLIIASQVIKELIS